ncbi:MAG: hypothetical protein ACI9AR_000217 [Flavobacteriaceae bacterium]|jgi:hypothetical protein
MKNSMILVIVLLIGMLTQTNAQVLQEKPGNPIVKNIKSVNMTKSQYTDGVFTGKWDKDYFNQLSPPEETIEYLLLSCRNASNNESLEKNQLKEYFRDYVIVILLNQNKEYLFMNYFNGSWSYTKRFPYFNEQAFSDKNTGKIVASCMCGNPSYYKYDGITIRNSQKEFASNVNVTNITIEDKRSNSSSDDISFKKGMEAVGIFNDELERAESNKDKRDLERKSQESQLRIDELEALASIEKDKALIAALYSNNQNRSNSSSQGYQQVAQQRAGLGTGGKVVLGGLAIVGGVWLIDKLGKWFWGQPSSSYTGPIGGNDRNVRPPPYIPVNTGNPGGVQNGNFFQQLVSTFVGQGSPSGSIIR